MNVRLYLWQRLTAALMVPLVLVHLALIFYAMRQGLSAADILSRTRGSVAWAVFYGVFVVAAAVHAPIGLRNFLAETFNWRGRSLDVAVMAIALTLAMWGFRAVLAVFI